MNNFNVLTSFSSRLKRIIMWAVSKEASNKEMLQNFVECIYKIAKSTCILVNKNERQQHTQFSSLTFSLILLKNMLAFQWLLKFFLSRSQWFYAGFTMIKKILWNALYLFALLILSDAFNHLQAEFDNCICN